MRILLLSHAFNSLTQRLFVDLRAAGYVVSIEFDINDDVSREAVQLFQPDVIVAPFLKRAIPEDVWRRTLCLIVHPGIRGDRGPSALDWAISHNVAHWGVTVLQAEVEMDAGPVWAYREFPLRAATKSSLYRLEVTEAATQAVLEALARLGKKYRPVVLDYDDPEIRGRWQPAIRQSDRAIDWRRDDSDTVLRKIRAADGQPGVRDGFFGIPVFLYDGHAEDYLRGKPGEVVAHRYGAICRATVDGAVWIGQIKIQPEPGERGLKLPATLALAEYLTDIPELPLELDAFEGGRTYREIDYREANDVGYLSFAFYNGAMSVEQCQRLLTAYETARSRPSKVIVLLGGPEFWSNGMHLNVIEAAASPADESWRNINAIDDLARAILTTDDRVTVAALRGNTGAGGVFLALAADRVLARRGIILNPHYKNMGNLYGSEYWTYVLPRRVGEQQASALTANRLPLSCDQALQLGLLDDVLEGEPNRFLSQITEIAEALAGDPGFAEKLSRKRLGRSSDEMRRPLESYRVAELEQMRLNFYGFDPSYHVARYNFVTKVPHSRTPLHLAVHRRLASRRSSGALGTIDTI